MTVDDDPAVEPTAMWQMTCGRRDSWGPRSWDQRADAANTCLATVTGVTALDIVAEGYDAGVRLGEVIDRDMIAVPV